MPLTLDYIHDEMIRVCVPHGGVDPLVPILKIPKAKIIKRAVELRVMKHPVRAIREAVIRRLWGTKHAREIAKEAGISFGYLYVLARNLELTKRRAA
jgi:hypothetical protein